MTELAGTTVLGLPLVQLVAVALASVLCGFVGTFVVLRRLVALGGGIAHAAFGGIGLGVVLGFEPALGAAAVAVAVAAVLAGETRERSDRRDAAIGVLWAVGMATGMLLLAGSELGDADVEGYLFGDIETVRVGDVGALALLVAVVAIVHARYGRQIVATAFDPEHAQLQGLAVRRLELGGMVLVALSVVALLQLVGVVLAIALLAIPPLVALRRLRGLPAVVGGAVACAAVMSLAGLAAGAASGRPAGPLIVLAGGALLAVSRLLPSAATRTGRGAAVVLLLSLGVVQGAAAAAPETAIGSPTSIELLGAVVLETDRFEGEPVGGLSGLVWEPASGRWLALSDDPSERAPARIYELEIDLGDGRLDAGDVTVVGRRRLLDGAGRALARGSLDPEGLALAPDGTLYLSSEGVARRAIAPFVARIGHDGRELGRLPLGAHFAPDGAESRGVRPNLGFESLTVSPDGRWLIAGLENALVQDGPAAGPGEQSPARVVVWSLEGDRPARELVYRTESVQATPPTDDSLSVAGLVDLLALAGDRYLALEREYVAGVGLRVGLYLADAAGATDVSGRERLGDDDYVAIAKRRLLDFGELGIALDNFEGIALGSPLADGRRSLIAIADDNFNRILQRTWLVAFAVDDRPLTIASVQGRGHRSPYEGRWIDGVEGVVTAVDARARPPAFFLESAAPDRDPATAEAVRAVMVGERPPPAVGDAVRIGGRVVERAFDDRQLPVTTILAGAMETLAEVPALPAPVRIGGERRIPPTVDADGLGEFRPDRDALDFWESLEAMRIEVAGGTVTGPTLGHDELVLLPAGSSAAARTAKGGLLLTEAGPSLERVLVSGRLAGGLPRLAVGDRIVAPVVGVVDYSYSNYKLLALAPIVAERAPDRCRESTRLAGLTLATFNVENLSAADSESRFARAAEVVAHRLGAPAIVALEEIQDDSGREGGDGVVSSERTLGRLVDAVVAAGGPRYETIVIDPELDREGGVPGGNIRVALLYDPVRVGFERRGAATALDATEPTVAGGKLRLTLNPGRVAPRASSFTMTSGESVRRSLAAEFRVDGRSLFVIANHWSSKFDDDRAFGAVQPPRRPTGAKRRAQAVEIRAFVERLLELDPRARVAVVGDLNDLPWSAPIEQLSAPPLVNLVGRLPVADRYTYNFEGSAQAIDHIVVSPSLADGAEIEALHVSSDCPEGVRASDHDPVIVRLPVRGP